MNRVRESRHCAVLTKGFTCSHEFESRARFQDFWHISVSSFVKLESSRLFVLYIILSRINLRPETRLAPAGIFVYIKSKKQGKKGFRFIGHIFQLSRKYTAFAQHRQAKGKKKSSRKTKEMLEHISCRLGHLRSA